ncbi:MAG: STAS domain-containing protein [Deltaproteobacteria bacterium]
MNIRKNVLESGIVVMEISGNIRMGADCDRITLETEQMIARQQSRVIFDFAQLDYLDSAGIGMLVNCLSKLKRAGGGLRLASLKPMVAGVFKLTKLDSVVGIFPSVAEAAQDFPLSR